MRTFVKSSRPGCKMEIEPTVTTVTSSNRCDCLHNMALFLPRCPQAPLSLPSWADSSGHFDKSPRNQICIACSFLRLQESFTRRRGEAVENHKSELRKHIPLHKHKSTSLERKQLTRSTSFDMPFPGPTIDLFHTGSTGESFFQQTDINRCVFGEAYAPASWEDRNTIVHSTRGRRETPLFGPTGSKVFCGNFDKGNMPAMRPNLSPKYF